MDLAKEDARALRYLLARPDHGQGVPPPEVVEAVATLLGGRTARCALSEDEDVGYGSQTERTQWMVTVATDTDIIRVTASGATSAMESPNSKPPDELSATCIPLSEVTSLTVTRVTDSGEFSSDLFWIVKAAEIRFRDHEQMSLPGLPGPRLSGDLAARPGEFVSHVRSVWPTSSG